MPTLLVDGGDCFFLGSTIRAPSEAEETRDVRNARVVLGAYNALGYQALGIGPGDLQYGLQTLRALEREARFPFLCANVVEKGSVLSVLYGLDGVLVASWDETPEALRERLVEIIEKLDEKVEKNKKNLDVQSALDDKT